MGLTSWDVASAAWRPAPPQKFPEFCAWASPPFQVSDPSSHIALHSCGLPRPMRTYIGLEPWAGYIPGTYDLLNELRRILRSQLDLLLNCAGFSRPGLSEGLPMCIEAKLKFQEMS